MTKEIEEFINKVICGDVMRSIRKIPDKSIDSVITSPPYYQLRDYGFDGQWGLEKTYREYLEHLWALMIDAVLSEPPLPFPSHTEPKPEGQESLDF